MKKVIAIRSGEGCDIGAKQMDIGCAAIGVGHVNHRRAIVCQVEVHQAIDGKALATPVYIMQDGLPGERKQVNNRNVRCMCVFPNHA